MSSVIFAFLVSIVFVMMVRPPSKFLSSLSWLGSFATTYLLAGFKEPAVTALFLPPLLLVLWAGIHDVKEYLVHDGFSLGVFAWGIVVHGLWFREWTVILAGLIIGLVYSLLLRIYGMITRPDLRTQDYGFGTGDILMICALGVVFGPLIMHVVFVASLLAVFYVLGRSAIKKEDPRAMLTPFVAFLWGGSLIISVFLGDRVYEITRIAMFLFG